MAARNHQGQDTFSMTQLRFEQMVLASSTQGAFPVANRFLLRDWQRRLSVLGTIREQLHDHSLCKDLLNVTEDQLFFLQEALQQGRAIVYLLHGNASLKAHRQCENHGAVGKREMEYVCDCPLSFWLKSIRIWI